MRQLVLFQTGNIEFALDRNCISRIQPISENAKNNLARTQQQSIEVEGNERLLIDLGAVSDQHTAAPCATDAEMILLKASPLALLADQVKSTLELNGERLEQLPSIFGGTARACFPEVLHLEDQVALVIDPRALADVETYAATLSKCAHSGQEQAEKREEMQQAEETQPPVPVASAPVADERINAIVGEKLRKIIGQRVQQVVARTMAHALAQQMS